MNKQNKVLNRINRAIESGQTTPLGTKPNDECYTDMVDIIQELNYWGELGKFKGKNIICPCDWDIDPDNDIYGCYIEFTSENNGTFNAFDTVKDVQLQKFNLSSLIFDDSTKVNDNYTTISPDNVEDFLRNKLTCNFVRTLSQNAKRWGIKSITASGYNPATNKGIKFQDVDYSKYDICITNPPFSLYAEFMNCIVDKIDFICLAPFLNRVNPNIGLPLMLKKAYLGHNIYIGLNFYNPTSTNEYKQKSVACDWITSYSEAQEERNAEYKNHKSGVDYNLYKDDYLVYENITMKDGTHPIRVPATQLPDNYNGWMLTSVNVLNTIDLDEYEWYITNAKKYFNTTNPSANPFAHKATDTMLILNGKKCFHGIVLKKKTI